jgi:hypothetical protein
MHLPPPNNFLDFFPNWFVDLVCFKFCENPSIPNIQNMAGHLGSTFNPCVKCFSVMICSTAVSSHVGRRECVSTTSRIVIIPPCTTGAFGSTALGSRLELRPHTLEPSPYFERETRLSDDAKPFSLYNSGRFFQPGKSWAQG